MRGFLKVAGSRRRFRRLHRRGGGFVLIEALAAFAILTMSLAALMSGIFGAVNNDDRADFMLRATRVARSELEAVGVETLPQPGVIQGKSDDGLTYIIRVNLVASPPQLNPLAPTTIAFWAHIDVTRGGEINGKALTLGFDTFKISTIKEPGK